MAKSYDIPTQDDIDVQLDYPTRVLSLKVGDDLIALDRTHAALLATRLINALADATWPKRETPEQAFTNSAMRQLRAERRRG